MRSLFILLAGTILLQFIMMIMGASTLYKYNISGTLYCSSEDGSDKMMPDMQIYLMEEDGFPDLDDVLGNVVTDGQGHFEGLVGEEDEGNEPESYLEIPIHSCKHISLRTAGTTRVWLPAKPERQNLTIYLGKNVAMLHREGQEDMQLGMNWA